MVKGGRRGIALGVDQNELSFPGVDAAVPEPIFLPDPVRLDIGDLDQTLEVPRQKTFRSLVVLKRALAECLGNCRQRQPPQTEPTSAIPAHSPSLRIVSAPSSADFRYAARATSQWILGTTSPRSGHVSRFAAPKTEQARSSHPSRVRSATPDFGPFTAPPRASRSAPPGQPARSVDCAARRR